MSVSVAVCSRATAVRLCENHGVIMCGAVFDNPDSGYSRFFEKKLSA
jgi:putative acetyltransferase